MTVRKTRLVVEPIMVVRRLLIPTCIAVMPRQEVMVGAEKMIIARGQREIVIPIASSSLKLAEKNLRRLILLKAIASLHVQCFSTIVEHDRCPVIRFKAQPWRLGRCNVELRLS